MRTPVFHRRFDYDRGLLPNRHLAELERGVETIEQARERSGATIGYPGWGLVYFLLLSHLDPAAEGEQILIETGTNWGCTTIVLAQALADAGVAGRVLSFEIDAGNVARARENLLLAGLADRAEIVAGDTRETLPKALSGRRGLRFALLDASHLFDDVMAEFEALLPHLADDALVLLDNTYRIAEEGEDPRVNGALPEMLKRHGGNLINLEYVSWYTPGLAVWQRRPKL